MSDIDRRKSRHPDEATKRAMSELTLERLLLWGRVVGVLCIVMGLVMLAFTAPPLGGTAWDPNESFLVLLLIAAGGITFASSMSPPRH